MITAVQSPSLEGTSYDTFFVQSSCTPVPIFCDNLEQLEWNLPYPVFGMFRI